MTEQQRTIDWDSPAAAPRKMKMIDALRVDCGCVRKYDAAGKPRRGCSCALQLRSVLRALDSFQRQKRSCWPSVAAIAARASVSVRTAQRYLRMAERLGFVAVSLQPHSVNHDSIVWLAIWNQTVEKTDSGRGDKMPPAEVGGGDKMPPRGCQIVTGGGCQIVTLNSHVLNLNESHLHLHQEDDEDEGMETTRSEILKGLIALRVNKASVAIATAQEHGTSLETMQAIIRYASRFPGRYPPGVIYARFTEPDAEQMQPDSGWYGDEAWIAQHGRPAPETPQRSAEDEHGSDLDQMTPSELTTLADHLPIRDRGYVLSAIQRGHGLTLHESRRQLLRALAMSRRATLQTAR